MPNEQPHRQSPPKGAVSKTTAKAVLTLFPVPMIEAIDHIVTAEDTDRSKWIRRAMREALQRRGISA
jgi:hypothetical protein